jgi:catechol 2,3-dioxygenase-like lactoylglutathione lyase family enzyme
MSEISRRSVLAGVAAASLAPRAAFAQAQGPAGPPPTAEEIAGVLPLRTTGLEHIAMIVPDVTVSATFYSKLFNPDGLHKEQEGDLRYYVTLDPDPAAAQPIGYIAIGSRPAPPPPFLDHFCPLVVDYNAAAVAARAEQEGFAPGRFGIMPDPDGLGLQLLGAPAGLAASTEPATRIVNGDALVRPRGLDHVMLYVSDLDRSAAYYRSFFGPEASRGGDPEQIWFELADTRIGLQRRGALEPARVDHFALKTEPFDREAVTTELRLLGARVAPVDEADESLLRFRDPYGLGVALRPI